MRVLIAEDDPVSRLLIVSAVMDFGHEVFVAEDGEQAWKIFQNTPAIDAVVSDWMMPHVDGLDLFKRVRRANDEIGDYTYCILLTARDSRDYVVRGIEGGADDYLAKPLDRGQLEARLKSAARVTGLRRRWAEKSKSLEEVNTLLRQQSRRDPLTGLGNRLRLDEHLESLRDRTQRYGYGYCLVLADIDQFKTYNDHYGHQAGDETLRQVARALAHICRPGDVAYRYGGEEILAVLPEQSTSGGAAFAERLRRSVQDLGILHERNLPAGVVTLSVGVAAEDGSGRRPGEVLRHADVALYRAKAAGRNCVVASSLVPEAQGLDGCWPA